jgi:hypothetical protein
MHSTSSESSSWTDRALRLLTDPSRRIPLLILVAYVAAALGLGVAFFGGIRNPNSDVATYGILLLFVSFASLFYVSVTVLSLDRVA